MSAPEARYLPIIYLRGFTFGKGGTEATVDDPFYGFNTGSTHVRQDETGQPRFYVFESPVLRLMSDHDYRDSYVAGVQVGLDETGQKELEKAQEAADAAWASSDPPVLRPGPEDAADDPHRTVNYPVQRLRRGEPDTAGVRSLWIYRYYDQASRTYPNTPGRRQEIEESALGLSDLIDHVKDVTGAPRVILLGHSTGGLIIRCLLQRTYPNLDRRPAEHVDKVFTFATPHGGIRFATGGGVVEWIRDKVGQVFDQSNIDDFGRQRMWEYLHTRDRLRQEPKPYRRWDPRDLRDVPPDQDPRDAPLGPMDFPPERFFSMVGTNPEDYDNRLSATGVGAHSDGLVQIENAYVRRGPRAYAHRSHSGRYGIVNSAEAYQNLERFLFGDLRVHLELDHLDALREQLAAQAAKSGADGLFHHLDATVSVRGLPALMHNQQIQHNSAIPLEYKKLHDGEPIPLFTVFLMSGYTPTPRDACRYTLRLRLQPVQLENGLQLFTRHTEQVGSWEGVLDVDTAQAEDGRWTIGYRWRFQEDQQLKEPAESPDFPGALEVPFPPSAADELGRRAVLRLTPTSWNDWHDS